MVNTLSSTQRIQWEFERLLNNSSTSDGKKLRKIVLDAFTSGLQAVMPEQLINTTISVKGTELIITSRVMSQRIQFDLMKYSSVLVIGGGKATAGLVKALISKIGVILPCYGSINIPYGQEQIWGDTIKFVSENGISSEIEITYASHPIPDKMGVKGTKKILDLVSKAKQDTLVVVVISGGGSALMPFPKDPITIKALQSLNEVLLECGANIVEINTIRKHVSDIKGGQLAQAIYPRTGLTLILSDVKGDPLDTIASGPTTYDNSTYANAWETIEKYRIVHIVPESIRVILRKGVNGLLPETPKQNHPAFSKITNMIIGSAANAISEMKTILNRKNFQEISVITPIELYGEAKEVGKKLARILVSLEQKGILQHQIFMMNSGECTVTIKGKGTGGRNQEMLLSMLEEIIISNEPLCNFCIVSMAFDGIEGNSPSAGAIIDNEVLVKIKELKLNPSQFLEQNNSFTFFKELGEAIEIGHTGTNVNDIYCLLIEKK